MKKDTKKYQIVVQGERNLMVPQPLEPCVYPIEAESFQDAQSRALSLFKNEWPDVLNVTYIDNGAEKRKNIFPIVCMAFAYLLSLIPWEYDVIKVFTLAPSGISTMFAVALYSAVMIRFKGLDKSFNSPSEIILSILNILFCASFLSLFVGDTEIKFFIFPPIPIPGNTLLMIAVGFSWLGMSAVAGIVWVILFILAVGKLAAWDVAMGFFGSAYILSAFLGLVLQLKNESAAFRKSFQNDFLNSIAKIRRRVVKDIGSTGQAMKSAAATVTAAAKNTIPIPSEKQKNGDQEAI